MIWGQTIAELFARGGVCMWPLLGCSVLAVAVAAERLLLLALIPSSPARFQRRLLLCLDAGDTEAARKLCASCTHPAARVAEAHLGHCDSSRDLRDQVLLRIGTASLDRVERRLHLLSLVTQVAPLLGLLGTVTGLVSAFYAVQLAGGVAQPGELAGGIWEALITTVFGLVIAIPASVALHLFENRVDRIERHMQETVQLLNERLERSLAPVPVGARA